MDEPGGDGAVVLLAADDGLVPGSTDAERAFFLQETRLFEIDQYYHHLEGLTPETSFVGISLEEGMAWRTANRGGKLSPAEGEHWSRLKARLQTAIEEMGQGQPVFVRLSTRSPKDAVDKLPERLLPILRQELSAGRPETATGRLDSFEVGIVELNAFRRNTGACLFDWVRDAEILTGAEVTVWRVNEQPPYKNMDAVAMPWKPLLDRALAPEDEDLIQDQKQPWWKFW